jgi:SPASM domain peptide maturase of grasp-with-spasm system
VSIDLAAHRASHLRLFADCIPVEGVRRSAIYDLTRHEVHLLPTEYLPLVRWLTSRTVGAVLDELTRLDDPAPVMTLIDFLDDNELVMLTDDPDRFPPIEEVWDAPGRVHNAIIDVDTVLHDFADLFAQLDALGCEFVQIRSFSVLLTPERCRELLRHARDTSIRSIELILRHDPDLPVDRYAELRRDEPLIVSMTVHSAPADRSELIDIGGPPMGGGVQKEVVFTRQVIDSERHCGVITPSYLNAPSVSNYIESRHFNGCLNRKISIDARGEIRNCPSMPRAFGSARRRRLDAVLDDPEFTAVWTVNKDLIDVCRQCEFRYICSDCRAYVEDPVDANSKPLKCGYDPTTGEWEPWYLPPFKAAVRDSYGIPLPSPR